MWRQNLNIFLCLFLSFNRLSSTKGSSTSYTPCSAGMTPQKPSISTPSTLNPSGACFRRNPSVNYISRSGNEVDHFITEALKLSNPVGAILECVNFNMANSLSPITSNLVRIGSNGDILTESSSTLPVNGFFPMCSDFNPNSFTYPSFSTITKTTAPFNSEIYSSVPDAHRLDFNNLEALKYTDITCLSDNKPVLSSQFLSSLDISPNLSPSPSSFCGSTKILDIPIKTATSSSQCACPDLSATTLTQDPKLNSDLLSPWSKYGLVQTPCQNSVANSDCKFRLKPANLKIVSPLQSSGEKQFKGAVQPLNCKSLSYDTEGLDLPCKSPAIFSPQYQPDLSSTISTQDYKFQSDLFLPSSSTDTTSPSNIQPNPYLKSSTLKSKSSQSSLVNSVPRLVKVKSVNLKMLPEFVSSSNNQLKGIVKPMKCKSSSHEKQIFDLPLRSSSDISATISTQDKTLHSGLFSPCLTSTDKMSPNNDLTQPNLCSASPQFNSFSFSGMPARQSNTENSGSKLKVKSVNLNILPISTTGENVMQSIFLPPKNNISYNREEIQKIEAKDLSFQEMMKLIHTKPNIEESVSHLFDQIDFTNPEVIAEFVALLKQLLIDDIIQNS